MPASWEYLPLPYDYQYYWFILDPKSKHDKLKVKNLKHLSTFQILKFWHRQVLVFKWQLVCVCLIQWREIFYWFLVFIPVFQTLPKFCLSFPLKWSYCDIACYAMYCVLSYSTDIITLILIMFQLSSEFSSTLNCDFGLLTMISKDFRVISQVFTSYHTKKTLWQK